MAETKAERTADLKVASKVDQKAGLLVETSVVKKVDCSAGMSADLMAVQMAVL